MTGALKHIQTHTAQHFFFNLWLPHQSFFGFLGNISQTLHKEKKRKFNVL